ncbi:MAG: D-glycero-alpha-D-manno-heptose-1,7-bisphosphate 7-phosphatase [Candidatus Binatia bacterium]
MMGRRIRGAAVFLDRDGTLIRDVGYLRRTDQIEILPRVPAALRLLRDQGFKIVVVTNQSAVARGWMSEEDLAAIHDTLAAQLAQSGASLDAIYYCPHHPVEGKGIYQQVCACRKPNSGMIERACDDLGLNPAASYVVGDQKTDIELAKRIGATALLIGASAPPLASQNSEGPSVVDLWQATQWILEHSKQAAGVEES